MKNDPKTALLRAVQDEATQLLGARAADLSVRLFDFDCQVLIGVATPSGTRHTAYAGVEAFEQDPKAWTAKACDAISASIARLNPA